MIVYLDKITSGIPTPFIDGKDVSSVIMIDAPADLPPFLLAGKGVLSSADNTLKFYDDQGVLYKTLDITDEDLQPIKDSISGLQSDINSLDARVTEVETLGDDVKDLSERLSINEIRTSLLIAATKLFQTYQLDDLGVTASRLTEAPTVKDKCEIFHQAVYKSSEDNYQYFAFMDEGDNFFGLLPNSKGGFFQVVSYGEGGSRFTEFFFRDNENNNFFAMMNASDTFFEFDNTSGGGGDVTRDEFDALKDEADSTKILATTAQTEAAANTVAIAANTAKNLEHSARLDAQTAEITIATKNCAHAEKTAGEAETTAHKALGEVRALNVDVESNTHRGQFNTGEIDKLREKDTELAGDIAETETRLNTKITEVADEYDSLSGVLDETRVQMNIISDTVSTNEVNIKTLDNNSKMMEKAVTNLADNSQKNFEELYANDRKDEADIKALQTKVQTVEGRVSTTETSISTLEGKTETLESNLQLANQKITENKELADKAVKDAADAKAEVQGQNELIDGNATKIEEVEGKVDGFENNIQKALTDSENSLSKASANETEIASLKTKDTEIETKVDGFEADIQKALTDSDSALTKADEAKGVADEAKGKADELDTSLFQTNENVTSNTEKIGTLDTKVDGFDTRITTANDKADAADSKAQSTFEITQTQGKTLKLHSEELTDLEKLIGETDKKVSTLTSDYTKLDKNVSELDFAVNGLTTEITLMFKQGENLSAKDIGYSGIFDALTDPNRSATAHTFRINGDDVAEISETSVDFFDKPIKNVSNGVDDTDAVNKSQLDTVSTLASDAKDLADENKIRLDGLNIPSDLVEQVNTNTSDIETNASAITVAKDLADDNKSRLDSLVIPADLSEKVETNENNIASNKIVAERADSLSESNKQRLDNLVIPPDLSSEVQANANAIALAYKEGDDIKVGEIVYSGYLLSDIDIHDIRDSNGFSQASIYANHFTLHNSNAGKEDFSIRIDPSSNNSVIDYIGQLYINTYSKEDGEQKRVLWIDEDGHVRADKSFRSEVFTNNHTRTTNSSNDNAGFLDLKTAGIVKYGAKIDHEFYTNGYQIAKLEEDKVTFYQELDLSNKSLKKVRHVVGNSAGTMNVAGVKLIKRDDTNDTQQAIQLNTSEIVHYSDKHQFKTNSNARRLTIEDHKAAWHDCELTGVADATEGRSVPNLAQVESLIAGGGSGAAVPITTDMRAIIGQDGVTTLDDFTTDQTSFSEFYNFLKTATVNGKKTYKFGHMVNDASSIKRFTPHLDGVDGQFFYTSLADNNNFADYQDMRGKHYLGCFDTFANSASELYWQTVNGVGVFKEFRQPSSISKTTYYAHQGDHHLDILSTGGGDVELDSMRSNTAQNEDRCKVKNNHNTSINLRLGFDGHYTIVNVLAGQTVLAWASREYGGWAHTKFFEDPQTQTTYVIGIDDFNWTYSSDPVTNTKNLISALPKNTVFVGYHDPNSSSAKFKIVNKGYTSNLEGEKCTYIITKQGNGHATGMSTTEANDSETSKAWMRVLDGKRGRWYTSETTKNFSLAEDIPEGFVEDTIVFTGDQGIVQTVINEDGTTGYEPLTGYNSPAHEVAINELETQTELNSAKTHFFKNESSVTIPYNNPENHPIVEVYVLDTSKTIQGSSLVLVDSYGMFDGTYNTVGSLYINTFNQWQSTYSYHNAYKHVSENKYVVFDTGLMNWILIQTDVLHTEIGSNVTGSKITLGGRSQLPESYGNYTIALSIENLSSLEFVKAEASLRHDDQNKTVIIDFGDARPSGKVIVK